MRKTRHLSAHIGRRKQRTMNPLSHASHPRRRLLPNRAGAPRLQRACSGPPGDSSSGCPRSQGSPGTISFPQRTHGVRPSATMGSSARRPPRWVGFSYFALRTGLAAIDAHRLEQNWWFTLRAMNLEPSTGQIRDLRPRVAGGADPNRHALQRSCLFDDGKNSRPHSAHNFTRALRSLGLSALRGDF